MSLIVLVFAVATLNLCLGYFLAVELGYGPPTLAHSWVALAARRRRVRPRAARAAAVDMDDPDSLAGPSVEELVGEATMTSLEDLLDEPVGSLEVEPYDEPYDDDVAEALGSDTPENWDLDEKYVETSILRLNIAMMKSGRKATEIDTRLREAEGHADAETIRDCLAQLREDCETYLAEQAEAAQNFEARIGELGELRSLGEEITMTNLEQAAQIETTLSNLTHMDFQSDLEAANRRLRTELAGLRQARHKLRDSQEVAFLAIAKYENRIQNIEAQLYNDPLTGLRNRIGLETSLWRWWQQKRHQSRQMCATLVDLDHFGRINEDHGSQVGDDLLRHVAGALGNSVGPGDLVGRYAGQRFLVVTLDLGPRTATKNIEVVRQTIEKTTFVHGEKQVHLTLSGVVSDVAPEDTVEGLLARLEHTLAEAKKSGRNCLFDYDSQRAEPKSRRVESPSFGVPPVAVRI